MISYRLRAHSTATPFSVWWRNAMGNELQRIAQRHGGLIVTDGATTIVYKPTETGRWVGKVRTLADSIKSGRSRAPKTKRIKTPEEKQRERWRRWLGAVCREDMDTWVELLGGDWSGWPRRVLPDAETITWMAASREAVRDLWRRAIDVATPEDFNRLDGRFCADMMEKRAKRKKRR